MAFRKFNFQPASLTQDPSVALNWQTLTDNTQSKLYSSRDALGDGTIAVTGGGPFSNPPAGTVYAEISYLLMGPYVFFTAFLLGITTFPTVGAFSWINPTKLAINLPISSYYPLSGLVPTFGPGTAGLPYPVNAVVYGGVNPDVTINAEVIYQPKTCVLLILPAAPLSAQYIAVNGFYIRM